MVLSSDIFDFEISAVKYKCGESTAPCSFSNSGRLEVRILSPEFTLIFLVSLG